MGSDFQCPGCDEVFATKQKCDQHEQDTCSMFSALPLKFRIGLQNVRHTLKFVLDATRGLRSRWTPSGRVLVSRDICSLRMTTSKGCFDAVLKVRDVIAEINYTGTRAPASPAKKERHSVDDRLARGARQRSLVVQALALFTEDHILVDRTRRRLIGRRVCLGVV